MLGYPGAVQQMIITHLIYLYSHFAPNQPPVQQRYGYNPNSAPRDEAASRRSMYNLRQVVHALAHNDDDQPRAGHYFKAKPSVWQEHLLRNFELLAPFPQETTTEEEAFDFMWGPSWREDLNLALDCNFLNLARLADLPASPVIWEFLFRS